MMKETTYEQIVRSIAELDYTGEIPEDPQEAAELYEQLRLEAPPSVRQLNFLEYLGHREYLGQTKIPATMHEATVEIDRLLKLEKLKNMIGKEPLEAQLESLKSLKYQGTPPKDRAEASMLIDEIRSKTEGVREDDGREFANIPEQARIASYYRLIREMVADLEIEDEELRFTKAERNRLGLNNGQIKAMHAKLFAAAIVPLIEDSFMDEIEEEKLRKLRECLQKLGWAPGS